MSSAANRLLVLAAMVQARQLVHGEILTFEQRPIPSTYSLQGLVAFTVYAPSDAPAGAPNGEHPWAEYRRIQVHSTSPDKSDSQLADYTSLQLILIHEDDYHSEIEKGPGCDTSGRLHIGSADVTLHTTGFTQKKDEHVELKKTGTYFLLMSNCGNFSQGTLSGDVAVRNVYGFTSGTDYHKMVGYGWLFCAYAILALVWGALCMMWKSELIAMHGIVAVVIGLRLVESGGWYFYLSYMNQVGTMNDSMLCVLVMLSVLSTYTSYSLILVTSQGWRMTEEVLSNNKLCQMSAFGIIWISVSYLREGAVTHRQTFRLSTKFMTGVAISSMFVNLLIFAWIFMSLGKLIKKLKERSLHDQLQLITRFSIGLIIAGIFGMFVFCFQLLDTTESFKIDWKYQFATDNGLSQGAFLSMVCLAMFLWKPHSNSSEMGYQPPAEQEGDGLWKEDGGDEEAKGGDRVAPAVVGVAADGGL